MAGFFCVVTKIKNVREKRERIGSKKTSRQGDKVAYCAHVAKRRIRVHEQAKRREEQEERGGEGERRRRRKRSRRKKKTLKVLRERRGGQQCGRINTF